MQTFRRAMRDYGFVATALLLVWVAFGRRLFGSTIDMGWLGVAAVAPFALVGTGFTTYLGLRRSGGFSSAQAWLQLTCLLCLVVAGFAMDDADFFGEAYYDGILSRLLGGTDSARTISGAVLTASFFLWLVGWLLLAVSLLMGRAHPPRATTSRTSAPGQGAIPRR